MEFIWMLLTAFIFLTLIVVTIFAVIGVVYIIASIAKYVKEKKTSEKVL